MAIIGVVVMAEVVISFLVVVIFFMVNFLMVIIKGWISINSPLCYRPSLVLLRLRRSYVKSVARMDILPWIVIIE